MKKNKEDYFINPNNTSISMNLFYKDVRKYKPMSIDQQVQLAIKAKNGDQTAIQKLIESNQRFIVKIAKEYINMGLQLEDLISEGNIGLIRSIPKYDENRNVGFLSYAVWWIRQAMLQAVYDTAATVRLPTNKINLNSKLSKIREQYLQQNHREPSIDEICENSDLNSSEVRNIFDGNVSVSLETSLNGDDEFQTSPIDFISNTAFDDIETKFNKDSLYLEIAKIFKEKLSQRESDILNMYFGLNGHEKKTLKEIGKKLKLTNERVRQIKSLALKKMRQHSTISRLFEHIEEE